VYSRSSSQNTEFQESVKYLRSRNRCTNNRIPELSNMNSTCTSEKYICVNTRKQFKSPKFHGFQLIPRNHLFLSLPSHVLGPSRTYWVVAVRRRLETRRNRSFQMNSRSRPEHGIQESTKVTFERAFRLTYAVISAVPSISCQVVSRAYLPPLASNTC